MLTGTQHQIVDRYDALQRAFAVHHRQAPDLLRAHGFQDAANIVVRRAYIKLRKGAVLRKHHVPNQHFGRLLLTLAERDTNVAIRDHSNHVAAFADHRQESTVELLHDLHGPGEAGVQAAGSGFPRHDFPNFHVSLLSLRHTLSTYRDATSLPNGRKSVLQTSRDAGGPGCSNALSKICVKTRDRVPI